MKSELQIAMRTDNLLCTISFNFNQILCCDHWSVDGIASKTRF